MPGVKHKKVMSNVHRVALLFSSAALWGADGQFLKWMDRIAQEQLSQREAAVARVHTVTEAEARKQAVRAKILELIGGLPDYSGPLNAQITGRIETPKYVIEKVIFESLPKVFVTANVYRPKEPGRYPGVLMPMGHWNEGKPAAQEIAANLAMKGFALVVYTAPPLTSMVIRQTSRYVETQESNAGSTI